MRRLSLGQDRLRMQRQATALAEAEEQHRRNIERLAAAEKLTVDQWLAKQESAAWRDPAAVEWERVKEQRRKEADRERYRDKADMLELFRQQQERAAHP